MATFELTAPGGGKYQVDAPDEHAAVAALGQMLSPRQQAAEQPKSAPAAAEQPSALQRIREAIHAPTRALENGILMGLGDRARALIDSALSGGGYGQHLKNEQGETAQFAKDHPIASTALEGVGGAGAPLGALAAASKGVGLGAKMAYGAAAGAGIGGAQGALASKDWTDLPQVAKDAGTGAVISGAIGGAVPAAGKIIGAAYNAAANAARGRVEGMSHAAGSHLIDAVRADGPAAVQARIAELGPDAMLADAGPSLLGKAQGASLNSDEGRSVLQNTLTARDKGTNARIQSDVNLALGPKQDPQALGDEILARRREHDASAYPAALNAAPPVETTPIMTELVDRISQAPVGSMEHKALSNLQTMLTKKVKQPVVDVGGYQQYDKLGNERWQDVPVSHDDANVLHKVKGELDNVIEYDRPGLGVPAGAFSRQQASLKQMRFAINDALEKQVPGYKAANETSAMMAKRAEAVKAGTQYLGNGKTTPSPDYFAAKYGELSPDEQIAFQRGSNGEVNRVLGTKANDLQALRSELQGEGGWNTDKLATVHGIPAANELTNSVDRNLAFRNTYNKVVENSQTAQRQAAAGAMKPVPPGDVPLIGPGTTGTGLVLGGTKKALNAAYNAVRPDATRSFGEVAKALTEQGAKRDARIKAIVDALDRRQGNAVTAQAAGDRGSLLAAIAANGYAATRRDRK